MSPIGIVTHPRRDAARTAASALAEELAPRGVDARFLPAEREPTVEELAGITLVVSVGGDGTLLRAARVAWLAGAPVLGVKVGRLGFLTEVEPAEATAMVLAAVEGATGTEDRMALEATGADGVDFPGQWALNEIIVEKESRHRLVRLQVEVDGAYVTTFSADGVIVASPTGSTAYSFSSRGPIVSPSVECLVLTPVAAHMVFDRSFVLPPSTCVELRVVGEEAGLLSADGRESIELPVGSKVSIGRSARPVTFVRRPGAPGFLSLVRGKFGLPGDPAEDVGPGG